MTKLKNNPLWRLAQHFLPTLPRRRTSRRILAAILALLILVVAGVFSISQWYAASVRNQPLQVGVSFIPDYASSLGVDPQANLDALLKIGVKHFRLVSYWSDMEPTPGQYDFSQLDWQFQKIQAAGGHIDLTLGLRQPRWPECHAPGWVDTSKPTAQWQPQLLSFMTAVVNRYKTSPALASYQVENEYFLQGFGTCQNMDRSRLVAEYNLVKKLDPARPVIIGRSNNALGWPTGQPQPDDFSISVYKRVWDDNFSHRYLEYPFPAWFYGFTAGWEKLMTGKNLMIGELQAEAWPPRGQTIPQTSLAEQNKSLDAGRLAARFNYGRASGLRQIYLWGGEYWYYRSVVLHDNSLWQVASQQFQTSN